MAWFVWMFFGALSGYLAAPAWVSDEERLVRTALMAVVGLCVYLAWRFVKWFTLTLIGAARRQQ